jgi:tetratricopeptide (TPR) repeat protein
MKTSAGILEKAFADPPAALVEGAGYLETLGDDDPAERAATSRAMSLAARLVNQLDDSIAYARSGADVAAAAGLVELQELNLLTLAGSLAIAGQAGEALALIEDALGSATDDHMQARFQFQRGFVLNGLGEVIEARDAFETALGFFREVGDRQSIGSTLHNLGQIHTQIGELAQAERDLTEAMEIARDLGETASIPGLEHNLGLLAAYRGDIPEALDRLTRSDELYMEVTGAEVPQHVARCEVLISAGLFSEALALASEIAAGTERAGDAEHEARARMVAAQAALLAGEPGQAMNLAARARERYVEQGRETRALDAAEVWCEARYVVEGASHELAHDVSALIEAFDRESLVVPAARARLLAGRIAIDLGETDQASRILETLGATRTHPLEVRVQTDMARALLRSAQGDTRGAMGAVRSGLRLIDEHQSALAATDLRMGVERLGRELGEIGLGHALDSGRPRQVLEWMERTRARALRHRPVLPDAQDEVAALMAELRQVDAELRDSEGADAGLQARRRRLHEQITRADRVRRAHRTEHGGYTTEALLDELGSRALVMMAIHDRRLVAATVRRRRARVVDIGEIETLMTELGHLRFGMRRSALLGRQFDMAAVDRFANLLLGPLHPSDEEVVLVPPAPLMSVPWSVLAPLRGRPLSVSPSAEMWWRARQQTRGRGPVVVAGGPGLSFSRAEVEAVGAVHRGADLYPPGATVAEVGKALSGASLAHVACHAVFQSENPMFSSLRLGDGGLYVHDIERLSPPPSTVVLSACDSGYTETRSGDELAGLTSALLSLGSRSVVASVGLVPDSEATTGLMVDLHRGLVAGREVSEALAQAQEPAFSDPERALTAASFLVIGV